MRGIWLKGGPKHGVKEGTVLSVEPGRTVVRWVAVNQLHTGDSTQPMEVVDGRKLQVLEAFAHTWWQLGDMALLDALVDVDPCPKDDASTLDARTFVDAGETAEGQSADADTDSAAAMSDGARAQGGGAAAANTQAAARRRLARGARGTGRFRATGSKDLQGAGRRKGGLRDDCSKCVEIIGTCTTVEVTWQDGTVESNVRTIDLVPVKHMGAHDFFPEEYVVEKMDDDPLDAPPQAPVPAPAPWPPSSAPVPLSPAAAALAAATAAVAGAAPTPGLSLETAMERLILQVPEDERQSSESLGRAVVERVIPAMNGHASIAPPPPPAPPSSAAPPTGGQGAAAMDDAPAKAGGESGAAARSADAAGAEAPQEQEGAGPGSGGARVGSDEVGARVASGEGLHHIKLPPHLVPTMQAARQQLRDELLSSMAPADARHLDQLVAAGNLADTLHFVSSHPQSYSFLQAPTQKYSL